MNNQKPQVLIFGIAAILLFLSLGFVADAFRDQNTDQQGDRFFALDIQPEGHKAVFSNTLHCDNGVISPPNMLVLDSVSRAQNGDKTIHRTVVRVLKDAQPSNQPLDQQSVKSLKANASLNMVIENYAFKKHSEMGENGICEVSYEFTIESFSTSVECKVSRPSFHTQTAQSSPHANTAPVSRWHWLSRLGLTRKSA